MGDGEAPGAQALSPGTRPFIKKGFTIQIAARFCEQETAKQTARQPRKEKVPSRFMLCSFKCG